MFKIKVAIIGKNSYIGNSFYDFAKDRLEIVKIGSRVGEWENYSFSNVHSVLFCAGIAHIKEKNENESLYFEINSKLAIEIAKKAKKDGVKQFVYLSSVASIDGKGFYGKSKREAEELLIRLEDEDFKICILRPPMVYGINSKGNFSKLIKIAEILPFFPDYKNSRSMIYIDNLCNHILYYINNNISGTFLPQNAKHVCTTDIIKIWSKANNKKIVFTKAFNKLINILKSKSNIINKIFGDLAFEIKDSDIKLEVADFYTSVSQRK